MSASEVLVDLPAQIQPRGVRRRGVTSWQRVATAAAALLLAGAVLQAPLVLLGVAMSLAGLVVAGVVVVAAIQLVLRISADRTAPAGEEPAS